MDQNGDPYNLCWYLFFNLNGYLSFCLKSNLDYTANVRGPHAFAARDEMYMGFL